MSSLNCTYGITILVFQFEMTTVGIVIICGFSEGIFQFEIDTVCTIVICGSSEAVDRVLGTRVGFGAIFTNKFVI